MQFKTTQGQEAYAEILRETGRAVHDLREELHGAMALHPDAAISLVCTSASRGAELQIDGLVKAIKTASEVDALWSSVAGHPVVAAGGGDA